ncbi:hypothetical protein ACFQ46_18740 [Kineococcus sp. GCM10028916]|uniref:hypothetical protein n=1 Tax=Kineococcus sp. GCM10028916 TaxID=3273394 RepID=UPI00362A8D3B
MITRGGARRSLLGLVCGVLSTGAVLAGCGGGDSPDPAPTTTTRSPTETTTSPASAVTESPTSSGPTFDCASVDAAQKTLDDAYAAELSRLGIRRGDSQAQSVLTLVTTTEGPGYYAAVLAASPPEESQDAQLVLDYYQRLAAQAGDLTAGSGSAEDLAAAMDRLDDATLAVSPDANSAAQVVSAQERLQAAVEDACSSGSNANPSNPSSSPSPSGPTSPASSTSG